MGPKHQDASEFATQRLEADAPGEGGGGVVLVLLSEEGAELVLLAPERPVVVGRRPPADVCIGDSRLSREHARFTLRGDGCSVTVEDLGSTNGTWTTEGRVKKARITCGEEVRLGSVLARVQVLGRLPDAGLADPGGESGIVAGPAMREILRMAENVAPSRAPILLLGETGTGKEVLAHFIHQRGPRKDQPLIRVNCAAIPGQLVESTLFGHERGAFTGAVQQHKGIFEEADGGTVFLDEIGELPPAAQAALLRVLETQQFSRVGSAHEIAVDVRIIAATHRDLDEQAKRGAFRADLFYRLSTLILQLPPLRERRDEIEPLARRFLLQANTTNGRHIHDIDAEAMALLVSYDWPGNVRELRNAIERAVILTRADVLRPQDLPRQMLRPQDLPRQMLVANTGPAAAPRKSTSTTDPHPVMKKGDAAPSELRPQVQEYEAHVIREALEAAQWRRATAAERLGMPLRTLSHKMKVLGIRKPTP